jgi:hypothetical protein
VVRAAPSSKITQNKTKKEQNGKTTNNHNHFPGISSEKWLHLDNSLYLDNSVWTNISAIQTLVYRPEEIENLKSAIGGHDVGCPLGCRSRGRGCGARPINAIADASGGGKVRP